MDEIHPNSRQRKIDPLWTGLIRRIDRINLEISNRGKVSEKSLYFYRPKKIIPEVDSESDSVDTNDHDVAVIDISRFSIHSDEDDAPIQNDATVAEAETSNEPRDEVHSIPELEVCHPSSDEDEIEPVELIDQLDEVELGKSFKSHL